MLCEFTYIYFSFIFQYTLSDLLTKVQASEAELLEALKKVKAIEIDGGLNWLPRNNISIRIDQTHSNIHLVTYFSGHWRLLDADYKEHVVVRILTLLEEKDWSYEAVPMKECCDILEELEPRCV